jgi:hypothetical protein
MPEEGNANIEVARHLREHHKEFPSTPEHRFLETIEAIVLAIIAVTTAWSGYQAALWNGHQAELYSIAGKLRVQAEGAATAANQERLYNASTVAEWLRAEAQGQTKLADIFERRFLPEFRPVFEAWKKTDPLNNVNAPAGPQQMPGYHSARSDEASKLNDQAAETFEQGNVARQHSDQYVRVTVTLATLLLLISIAQRFKIHAVRLGIAVIVVLLLSMPVYRVLTLPSASIPKAAGTGK